MRLCCYGLENQKTELGMNYLDSEEGIAVSSSSFSRITFRSDGLTVSNSKSSWAGCRGTIPVTKSGRYYYECRMEGNPKGICRVGWSTLDSSLNLGTSKRGYGFGATGNKATSNQFAEYGVAFGVGDIIGCTLDLDAGTISFSKNGTDLGVAFSGVNASVFLDFPLPPRCPTTPPSVSKTPRFPSVSPRPSPTFPPTVFLSRRRRLRSPRDPAVCWR